jgi:hypothetical protein
MDSHMSAAEERIQIGMWQMTIRTTVDTATGQYAFAVTNIRKVCDDTFRTLQVVADHSDASSQFPTEAAALAAAYFWATENLK